MIRIPLTLCILIMAACVPTAASTPTAAPTSIPAPIPTITPAPTAEPPSLTIWLPDTLYPLGSTGIESLLEESVTSFRRGQGFVPVTLRRKAGEGPADILETLRTASAVAPDALPDLALLRAADVIAAARAGYLQALTERLPPALADSVLPAALALGRVENTLYGLAFVVEVEHIAYHPLLLSGGFNRFSSVLEDRQSFVFPAAAEPENLSSILLVQYLAAGGTLTELREGTPNPTALRTLLTFYADAAAAGIIDSTVMGYRRPEDYLSALADARLPAGIITSSQYLALRRSGPSQDLAFAPIPLPQGEPASVIDGWLWVMVAQEPDQQALAWAFVEWMMDGERLAEASRLMDWLPARLDALATWGDDPYLVFVGQLLRGAMLPLPSGEADSTLIGLQEAVGLVIAEGRTPTEAAWEALGLQLP